MRLSGGRKAGHVWWSTRPIPSLRLAGAAAGIAVALTLAAGCQSSVPATTIDARGQSPIATSTPTSTSPAQPTATTGAPSKPTRQPVSTAGKLSSGSARRDPRLYPDPGLTPGDVLPVTAAQVSVAGYSSRVRDVPASEKAAVYAEYRLSYPQKPGAYECDHFIPLCLGGSNSIKNLWPEPAPQFHWKDGLEDYLWHQVRAGRLSLPRAQAEIRTDWYTSWVRAGRPGYTPGGPAASQAPAPATSAATGLVVGWSASASGKRYHYLTCPHFAQISPWNRRTGTVAQAEAAGKTPCRVCKPPE